MSGCLLSKRVVRHAQVSLKFQKLGWQPKYDHSIQGDPNRKTIQNQLKNLHKIPSGNPLPHPFATACPVSTSISLFVSDNLCFLASKHIAIEYPAHLVDKSHHARQPRYSVHVTRKHREIGLPRQHNPRTKHLSTPTFICQSCIASS